MQKVILTVGGIASGKSTWAKEEVRKSPEKTTRINRDDLRNMMSNYHFTDANEKLVSAARDAILTKALKSGRDVILDETNLGKRNFDGVCKIVKELNIDCIVMEKPFYVELEEAISRYAARIGTAKVGEEVVRKFWKKSGGKQHQFYHPNSEVFKKRTHALDAPFTPAIQNENAPKAIISDLDGTLALFGNRRSPYDASQCDLTDIANVPVLETIKLYHGNGYKIIFCSGREDKDEAPTRRFIDTHLSGIEYSLFMRKTNDQRKDAIIKEEIFNEHIKDKFNVLFILDDRRQVVDQWRAMGLVCFQVAPGDF